MSANTLSYAASDVGCVREKNEDSHFASDELGLYVLADGMGGHPRGEVASELAVASVVDFVSERSASPSSVPLEDVARECVLRAHAKVAAANRADTEADSMGTTLSVLLVDGRHFVMASVGDSKCFCLSSSDEGRRIAQISLDDTVAASLILKGVRPELIRGRENHSLTQAVGLSRKVWPHVVSGILAPGDLIVMCSDGVTDYMPEAEFRSALLSLWQSPRALVQALIRGALDNGGGDNCTCICVLAKP